MFAQHPTTRLARLRNALLAAYRRALPDTRDTDHGLGAVIRPLPDQRRSTGRSHTPHAA